MKYSSGNDERSRRRVLPTRVVKTWGNVQKAETLLADQAGEAYLGAFDGCVLENGGAVLLDFGQEFHGTLRLTTLMIDGGVNFARLRLRTGESANEALTPLGRKAAGNDHAERDREITMSALSTRETNETGFRFAYIQVLEGGRVELKAVQGVEIQRDIEQLGTFECDDETLNRIFDTAVRTAHLCMQDYLWDGIKRDRLVWMGDMHTEVLTILSVYGAQGVVTKSLDFLKAHTPPEAWMNGMPTYSLWWVIVNRDWYLYTGDRAYMMAQKDYLEALIPRLFKLIDENGCEIMPGKFLDWPTSADKKACHEGVQGMMKMAMDAASQLLKEMGNDGLSKACAETAERMKKHVPEASDFKSAGAVMTISGILDAEKAEKERLSVGGARGYSSFMGGYIMEARAMAGNVKGALDDARDFWGGMLKMGATTFWEDFSVDWMENAAPIDDIVPEGKKDIHGDFGQYCYSNFRHSLCHGWSSGPAWFFIKRVLGIRPLEPGFARVEIAPELGGLKYAKGSIPTPKGVLRVSARKTDGGVKTEIEAPEGIEIVRKA